MTCSVMSTQPSSSWEKKQGELQIHTHICAITDDLTFVDIKYVWTDAVEKEAVQLQSLEKKQLNIFTI